jgi:kynurenine formamidase
VIAGRRLVDLSLELAEDLPCSWPGSVPYRHLLVDWFDDGPFHTRSLELAEHTGTHFDAPTHWVPPPESGFADAGPAGAVSTDRVPLEHLTGPAVVVDVTGCVGVADPGHSPPIGAGALEAFESVHGRIEAGEVVLLRTGWDLRYVAGSEGRHCVADPLAGLEPAWPSPTPEAVSLLVERGVCCLGVDTPSVGAAEDGRPAHLAGLANGLVYVEGLARLVELPVRGATFFVPAAAHPRRVGGAGPGGLPRRGGVRRCGSPTSGRFRSASRCASTSSLRSGR